jgi:hypothetical protein
MTTKHAIPIRRIIGGGALSAAPLTIVLLAAAIALISAATAHAAVTSTDLGSDRLLDPPGDRAHPVEVAVGLDVTNLSNLDEVHETFQLDGYLFGRWHDPRLAHAGETTPRTYRPADVWIPKFEMINGVEPRSIFDSSVIVYPDGTAQYVERFGVELSSRLDLRRFPFDTERLLIVIHPFIADADRVVFKLDPAHTWIGRRFATYNSLAQWDFNQLTSQSGMVPLAGSPAGISEVRVEAGLTRKTGFYIWKVMLPLFLMVLLSWSVFWIEATDLNSQMQVAVVTLLTVIAFALALSSELPKVPYLTFIDVYFLTCYVFVFIAILELMTVHVTYRTRGENVGLRIRRISRWLVPLAFCAVLAMCAFHFLV